MDNVYTVGQVRGYLCNYQRRALGARPAPRDDVLVQRAAPLHEAPYAASSCVWSDIEQAMKALPFNWEKILWQTVCMGESSARNGTKRYSWRVAVADWWGITPGDVNKVVSNAIQEMTDSLNGVAVDNAAS